MPDDLNALKRMAAESAVAQVADGMTVGLGTGSTAELVLEGLAARIREGLRITGVPSSESAAAQARELGIPLIELGDSLPLDIAIDGADEVDPALNLIKGRGGAMLREKIVAQASTRFLVVVDHTKLVSKLGDKPVPVEIAQFGWRATARLIEQLGAKTSRRDKLTDNGNYILDCFFGPIDAPEILARSLDHVTGVAEHGLFIGMATEVHVGQTTGVQILR
jgi:ribose 5-phosphate isomerase A